ncbi:MAG: acyltransferase [Oscillospiraceae bacterium]|nr:acyltransferase [Oscillospiraceae bacterium]
MSATKQERNMGIDVLRAVAMFFVICQHILVQGSVTAAAEVGSGKYYFMQFLQVLVYCAVNIYGLTTGYLLCRKPFRLSRLVKLWLTTVFWSVAVSCVFFVLVPESRTFSEMVSMFLPILRGRYWFFTAYFVVMLVSPVLNVVIQNLSRRQFQLLFAALFLIFGVVPICSLGYDVLRITTGHHFSWMIVLYLIGGYLRVYPPAVPVPKKHLWLLGYWISAAVHLLYILAVNLAGLNSFTNLMLTYPSPLILAEAICLLQYCKDLPLKPDGLPGKLVRFIAPGVYSVYVIHVHPLVFWNKNIISAFRAWDSWNGIQVLGAILLTAFAVFTVCILLDALRQRLFRLLHIDQLAEKLSDRAEAVVRTHLNN